MTSRMTRARTHDGATADRVLAAIGVLAGILTIVGLSGVGDAPAPQAEARSIADHFQLVRTDVFIGAIFGMVGVAAMTTFALGLALRLSRRGERAAALAVGAGLTVVAAYLLATHVVYATLSYEVAAMSDDVTKGMFVATILAVPVFGLGVATLLAGTAVGSWRDAVMPRWWVITTCAAATLSLVAMFCYSENGFFSPDVQQQVVADVLIVWLAMTSVVYAVRSPHRVRS